MATDKDKLLDEAQKLLLRGQSEKAIKIYKQVLKLEPAAINHRQKLAELLSKAGCLKEARAEYETIGRHYSSNGFYLKAIAVYKKLQTMFPEETGISLTLAELNEKHGLTANALAEYRQVFDSHMKRNAVAEALLILEKMATVDRRNLQIKQMLAEAYFNSDRKEEAYAAFGSLAGLLQENGDKVFEEQLKLRIAQLFPEKSDFMLDVLAVQVAGGKGAEALSGLHELLRENPNNSRTWDILINAYMQLNQPQRLKAAALHCLKFFPEKTAVRKLLLECMIAEGELALALAFLEKHENEFFEKLSPSQLLEMYHGIRQIDPINGRILSGLQRAYHLAGESDKAEAVAASISSLEAFSPGRKYTDVPESVEPGNDGLEDNAGEPTVFHPTSQQVQNQQTAMDDEDLDFAIETDIEIDIDIDVDMDPDLDLSVFASENSFDADLFSVEPGMIAVDNGSSFRNVRFGSEFDNSDAQTHHDLGIAFREMELFEEAAREFLQAASDPSRTVACLLLRSASLRENGDLDAAEACLKILLQQTVTPAEFSLVKQELALVYQVTGRTEEAEQLLAEAGISTFSKSDLDLNLDFTDDDIDDFDLK